MEDTIKQELELIAKQFDTLKEEGAVHEAAIAEHQNALRTIIEEMVRLQGERRALVRITTKDNAPCSTPSNQETDSQK